MSRYTSVTVDVDVDLSDFDTQDLVDELRGRGFNYYRNEMDESSESYDGTLIYKIFHLRRQGKDYQKELDEYLYLRTGRAI